MPPERADNFEETAWLAVIGPTPRSTPSGVIVAPHNKHFVLDRVYELGGMQLKSADSALVEYHRDEPRTLRGCYEFVSYPVVISGTGPDAPQLEFIARENKRVQRATRIIALALGELWQTRSAPWYALQMPDPIGEPWPPPPFLALTGPRPHDGRDPHPLPGWVPDAHAALPSIPTLDRALGIWHQGILVESAHPSLALACYATTLDAIGQNLSLAEKLGIDQQERSGHRAGVGAVLAEVALPDQLELLAPIFHQRSRIMHDGALYGAESMIGAVFALDGLGAWPDESAERGFMLQTVPAARSVARAALVRLLARRTRE